ncbi:MAG: helix-turn-helix domain-containing protein [Alphaproteobacteria bacterium]|nr:helix-turn-helix domain-containing protein [Alphaproteobacteria bacterium]
MPEPHVSDDVWVPKALATIKSRYALALYLEIRRHCYEQPECWPSMRRLARAVGCSVGTVSELTDEFHRLGIITKTHTGRHCRYRVVGWRRRRARKTAHRSAPQTEDKDNIVVLVNKRENHKNERVSLDAAQQLQMRKKRVSMLVGLRRWVQLSPALPDGERPHRLALLDRAEAALDDWYGRSPEDRQCFEFLVARVRAKPLDAAIVRSLRQQPRPPDDDSIGAILASQGWYYGDRIDQSSRRGACTGQLGHSK